MYSMWKNNPHKLIEKCWTFFPRRKINRNFSLDRKELLTTNTIVNVQKYPLFMRDEDDPVVQRVAGTGLDQLKQTKIENVLTHKEKLKPSLHK